MTPKKRFGLTEGELDLGIFETTYLGQLARRFEPGMKVRLVGGAPKVLDNNLKRVPVRIGTVGEVVRRTVDYGVNWIVVLFDGFYQSAFVSPEDLAPAGSLTGLDEAPLPFGRTASPKLGQNHYPTCPACGKKDHVEDKGSTSKETWWQCLDCNKRWITKNTNEARLTELTKTTTLKPPKPPSEVQRLRTQQNVEKIELQQRQANQLMAAKIRDVEKKALDKQNHVSQPKPAGRPAS